MNVNVYQVSGFGVVVVVVVVGGRCSVFKDKEVEEMRCFRDFVRLVF